MLLDYTIMARCWLVVMPLPSLTMTNYIGIVFAVVGDDTDDDENDYNTGTNDFHTVIIMILIIIIPIMIITIKMTMIMIMIIVTIICQWTPVMSSRPSAWIPWGQRLDNLKSYTWWRHQMETFSALLALCAGNSPVTGEFPTQRPVTRSFDVFFDLRLNKRLSKQSWGWWFQTPLCSSWRHCHGFAWPYFLFGNVYRRKQTPKRARLSRVAMLPRYSNQTVGILMSPPKQLFWWSVRTLS